MKLAGILYLVAICKIKQFKIYMKILSHYFLQAKAVRSFSYLPKQMIVIFIGHHLSLMERFSRNHEEGKGVPEKCVVIQLQGELKMFETHQLRY